MNIIVRASRFFSDTQTHSVIGSLELSSFKHRYAETEFLKNLDEQFTCKFTIPNTGTPEQSFSQLILIPFLFQKALNP